LTTHANVSLADQFDPFELVDPFPFYERARHEEPIFYSADLDYWVVTRYNDVKAVFRDLETFSSAISGTPVREPSPEVKQILRDGGFKVYSGLTGRMPPDHTRIRSFISKAFTGQRIQVLEAPIRARVRELLDEFKGGRADIVSQLTHDLPALVLFMLLGIPDEDVGDVKRWAASRVALQWGDSDPAEQAQHAHNLVRYWRYCNELIDLRFEELRDDLPSDLVRIYQGGDQTITREEMATVCYTGHETTSHVLSEGIKTLLTHRASWEALCADPTLIPNAMEELLRYCPSLFTWRRITTRPVRLGEVDLPTGARLLLALGSANRDHELFPEAETFDITRPNAKLHVSLGYGVKYCLGGPLAKQEGRIVLEELTQRFPSLRLVPKQRFEYLPNITTRGPRQVWVEWDS
jgi:cytochrome P450